VDLALLLSFGVTSASDFSVVEISCFIAAGVDFFSSGMGGILTASGSNSLFFLIPPEQEQR
jgi:hypothetical protein